MERLTALRWINRTNLPQRATLERRGVGTVPTNGVPLISATILAKGRFCWQPCADAELVFAEQAHAYANVPEGVETKFYWNGEPIDFVEEDQEERQAIRSVWDRLRAAWGAQL